LKNAGAGKRPLRLVPLIKADGWFSTSYVRHTWWRVSEKVTTFASDIFAGAAVDMNLAEQQARLPCVIQLEVTEWQPSYKRSTLIQDLLVLTGSFSALVRSACPLRAPKHAP